MENYNPAEDENQGVASTLARNNDDTGEELEPDLSPSGNLPGPEPDLDATTLYEDEDDEDGLTSED
ncbi:hypothetical protein [Larkinella arboricola]|uniref:Uncharacterized protein n=1 Tax=Larkinella arboricola TaxID=643671 RepID=A0A327WNZ1_LARAB|nr:hypothetical protein [Larkinella arboricola]RAJ92287.1 hypothetical protein LX87_05256 [Larkinella arboricola]